VQWCGDIARIALVAQSTGNKGSVRGGRSVVRGDRPKNTTEQLGLPEKTEILKTVKVLPVSGFTY